MVFSINTNIQSLMTQRSIRQNQLDLSKTLERLASGLRINQASDDAAGLAISEKLGTQIRGLTQAIQNTQDGINLIQTAEGAMGNGLSILQRIRELSIQSANDTLTQSDRQKIQEEVKQLTLELDRLALTTEFNNRKLLDGSVEGGYFTPGHEAEAKISRNIRVGDNEAFPLDLRDFIAQIQSVSSQITVDTAISFKLIANDTGGVGMEVRSSLLGLITTVQDVGLLNSSSFGVSIDALSPTASLVTLDLNKGGFISGPVDRATPLNSLIAVGRFEPVQAGTFNITVGGTPPYSVAIDPAVDSINSIIGKINILTNPTHTFLASFNDVTNLFDIQVNNTAPVLSGPIVATNPAYSATPPAGFGPLAASIPGGWPPPPAGPDISPPGASFNWVPATADFPDLDAFGVSGYNTNMGLADTVGTFVADVFSGAPTVITAREITNYRDRFTGTVVPDTNAVGTDHDEFELTLTAIVDQIDQRSIYQTSVGGGINPTATWAVQGILFGGAASVDVSYIDSLGDARTVAVAVSQGDTPNQTFTDIVNALNADAVGAGATDSFSFDIGPAQLRIIHRIDNHDLTPALNTLTETTNDFVPDDVPTALNVPSIGPATGPADYPPGTAPAVFAADVPPYVLPAAGPDLVNTSITFGGNTNLQNALFLTNTGDTADTVTTTYEGVASRNVAHNSYTLTTTATESHNNTNNTTSTRRVGAAFQVDADDVGLEAIVQVSGREGMTAEADNALVFQIGANEGQSVRVGIDSMTAEDLGVEALNLVGNTDADSHLKSQNAISVVDDAIEKVSRSRSRLGAIQNRLEMSIASASIANENMTSSRSRIRDTDFARETANLTRAQIIAQAGAAILTQANIQPRDALQLLGQ